MKDELDFTFEELAYVNIGESLHRGVESGLKLYFPGNLTAFFNYNYQSAKLKAGTFDGNFIKALPRDLIAAGLSYSHDSGVGGGLFLKSARRTFLDDPNTIILPDYTTVDARLSYQHQRFTVAAEVFNLTNTDYSTTGFPDPAGSEVVLFYPAAERSFRLGVDVTF